MNKNKTYNPPPCIATAPHTLPSYHLTRHRRRLRYTTALSQSTPVAVADFFTAASSAPYYCPHTSPLLPPWSLILPPPYLPWILGSNTTPDQSLFCVYARVHIARHFGQHGEYVNIYIYSNEGSGYCFTSLMQDMMTRTMYKFFLIFYCQMEGNTLPVRSLKVEFSSLWPKGGLF